MANYQVRTTDGVTYFASIDESLDGIAARLQRQGYLDFKVTSIEGSPLHAPVRALFIRDTITAVIESP